MSSASSVGTKKMRQQGFPKLQHKLAGQKIWLRQEETKADREEAGKTVSESDRCVSISSLVTQDRLYLILD